MVMSRASFGVLTRKAPASKKKYADKKKKRPQGRKEKNLKAQAEGYILMKTLKILSVLSMQHPLTLELLWLRSKELINLLLERYRFLQLWSKEQK